MVQNRNTSALKGITANRVPHLVRDLPRHVWYCAVPLGVVCAATSMRIIAHFDPDFIGVYAEPLIALQRTGLGRLIRIPLRHWPVTRHFLRLPVSAMLPRWSAKPPVRRP